MYRASFYDMSSVMAYGMIVKTIMICTMKYEPNMKQEIIKMMVEKTEPNLLSALHSIQAYHFALERSSCSGNWFIINSLQGGVLAKSQQSQEYKMALRAIK